MRNAIANNLHKIIKKSFASEAHNLTHQSNLRIIVFIRKLKELKK